MGFSHDLTTHHFQLLKDGGEIAVTANDPKDTALTRIHASHTVGGRNNSQLPVRRAPGKVRTETIRFHCSSGRRTHHRD